MVAALLLALFVHEAGHLIALKCLGFEIQSLKLEPSGLRIDYSGTITAGKNIIAAAAGPLAGVIYALAIVCFVRTETNAFCKYSSELSFLYSAFNMLPLLPLDGGRIVMYMAEFSAAGYKLEKTIKKLSFVLSILLICFGLVLHIKGEGSGLFAAGLWTLLLQSTDTN